MPFKCMKKIKPQRKTNVIFATVAALVFVCFLSGCFGEEAVWGVAAGEIKDLPAVAASSWRIDSRSLRVDLIELDSSPYEMASALSKGKVDVAYIDAKKAIAAMARGELDVYVVAVTYRENSGKPERLLVAGRKWIEKCPEGAGLVLALHRKAIRALRENRAEAVKLVDMWVKPRPVETGNALDTAKWESGLYVEDLVGVVEDLRSAGAITAEQADAVALEFLQKTPGNRK